MDSDLIKLVNKLQDTFHNLGGELDMPQLVVVGSQSAGKSSVLETIVGRDFLPRGQGIVTRRPLVLQLIHTEGPEEWSQFLHVDKRFTSFEEVRKEIEQETFRVAGQNKGISKLPISLRIYSPNVLDLTLVDLPGLTKIPVGDQPSDIEKQIRNLVQDYISKPNCVILAVSPANVDLANSESLKLARAVDPQGRRTIGVLTKLDLMDAGTNALDILTGRVYPLKLGFIGVVNRSQQDIISEKSLGDALDSEEMFFRNHSAYRGIAHKNGTKYLAKSLNQVLMNHIREKLPDMKARLNTLMGQTQQELNSFGSPSNSLTSTSSETQSTLILRLMTQFARDFIASIDGTNLDISTKELSGGARIYYIFNDIFGAALNSLDPTLNLDAQDIRTAIRNSTGPRPSLFVPEVAFDLLVKPQIKLLEAPSLRCVELVYEELVRICHNCTSHELQRFPKLHSQLIEVVSELLRERLGPTSEYTQSLIEIQAAYINTNHPAFVAASASAMGVPFGAGSGGGAGGAGRGAGGRGAQIQAGGAQGRVHPPPPQRPRSADGVRSHPRQLSGDGEFDEEDGGFYEEGDSSSVEGGGAPNGTTTGRSVSSTVHDRKVSVSASSTTITGGKHHHHHQHSHKPLARPHSSLGQSSALSGSGGSPPTARETFLNYFFGQNGAASGGRNAGAGGVGGGNGGAGGIVPVGRDTTGVDAGMTSGLLAGKRTLDSGNAVALDMKSLGKHIEALPSYSYSSSPSPFSTNSNSSNNNPSSNTTLREEMETTLILSLITSYFAIVRQSILDLVPKAIMHFLVNFTSEHVQNRLVSSLYKPELFGDMLDEDEGIVAERTRVKALLDAYKEAFKTLSDVSMKPA